MQNLVEKVQVLSKDKLELIKGGIIITDSAVGLKPKELDKPNVV